MYIWYVIILYIISSENVFSSVYLSIFDKKQGYIRNNRKNRLKERGYANTDFHHSGIPPHIYIIRHPTIGIVFQIAILYDLGGRSLSLYPFLPPVTEILSRPILFSVFPNFLGEHFCS